MRWRHVIAGAAVAFALVAEAAGRSPGIAGRWLTEGSGSIVEFRPCVTDAATMCGQIVWLKGSGTARRVRTDASNPDPALRSRPLLGTDIVKGVREKSPGTWSDGRLYNPDDGRTYSGSIRLTGDSLELEGCALLIFRRSQSWHRTQGTAFPAQEH